MKFCWFGVNSRILASKRNLIAADLSGERQSPFGVIWQHTPPITETKVKCSRSDWIFNLEWMDQVYLFLILKSPEKKWTVLIVCINSPSDCAVYWGRLFGELDPIVPGFTQHTMPLSQQVPLITHRRPGPAYRCQFQYFNFIWHCYRLNTLSQYWI